MDKLVLGLVVVAAAVAAVVFGSWIWSNVQPTTSKEEAKKHLQQVQIFHDQLKNPAARAELKPVMADLQRALESNNDERIQRADQALMRTWDLVARLDAMKSAEERKASPSPAPPSPPPSRGSGPGGERYPGDEKVMGIDR